jgi:hypothetical protein
MVNSTTNALKVLAALTAADNNMGDDDGGSTADNGVVDGEGRQCGPRSRYEACRMKEIEMSLT